MTPFHISDRTLTFFANGRPWMVDRDHPSWAPIHDGLLSAALSADELVELADVKTAIQNADPAGLLRFVGDALQYGDSTLANVWVEKILKFRAEGLAFDPIFKGLESLMRNPSSMARERFPLFAERNKFGFLPDGRMVAYKVVRDNYTDVNSGTFDNSVGKVVKIDRRDVDDDPARTCSAGLHLGALEYLPNFGMWDTNRRVVLCAFWPEHVVAVPDDYNGTKMRVCEYEVIDDVNKKYVKEFVEARQTIVTGYAVAQDTSDDVDDADADEDDYNAGYAAAEEAIRQGEQLVLNPNMYTDDYNRGFAQAVVDAL